MIEREILQDIRKYKTKIVGSFTLRQLICLIISAAICIPTYFAMSKYFKKEFIILVIIVLCAFPMLCGFKEMYDVPFEKFTKIMLETRILAPTIRKYEAKNPYEEFFLQEAEEEDKGKHKKNVQKKYKHVSVSDKDPLYQEIK